MSDTTDATPEVMEEVATVATEQEAIPEIKKSVELEPGQELGQEPEPKKTFTQDELDAVIDKRLARERRKVEREQAEAIAEQQAPLQIESQLDPEAFSSTEDYITALATERADAIVNQREERRSVTAIENKYQNQIDEAVDKYPDYVQVAHTHKFMSVDMASVIKSSDIAVDLAYHLGTHLDEAEKIFKLPPIQQIKALGRLEMTLEGAPPKVKTTSAPAPITPVQKGTVTTPAYDTTDPRSSKTMSASEWIAKDRARRGFK